MIALFFEVTPKPGQDDRYLEIAAGLKPELERSGGVDFLDRFRSLTRPRTLLSHQLWRDEASLAHWRANGRHYGAQTAGRTAVFEDYRLRVGAVVAAKGAGASIAEFAPGIAYNDPAAKRDRALTELAAVQATVAELAALKKTAAEAPGMREEIAELRSERKQVRLRIEKLLAQMDQAGKQ